MEEPGCRKRRRDQDGEGEGDTESQEGGNKKAKIEAAPSSACCHESPKDPPSSGRVEVPIHSLGPPADTPTKQQEDSKQPECHPLPLTEKFEAKDPIDIIDPWMQSQIVDLLYVIFLQDCPEDVTSIIASYYCSIRSLRDIDRALPPMEKEYSKWQNKYYKLTKEKSSHPQFQQRRLEVFLEEALGEKALFPTIYAALEGKVTEMNHSSDDQDDDAEGHFHSVYSFTYCFSLPGQAEPIALSWKNDFAVGSDEDRTWTFMRSTPKQRILLFGDTPKAVSESEPSSCESQSDSEADAHIHPRPQTARGQTLQRIRNSLRLIRTRWNAGDHSEVTMLLQLHKVPLWSWPYILGRVYMCRARDYGQYMKYRSMYS